MRREERERILSEGAVRPESPRERLQARGLAEDVASLARAEGGSLTLRLRNFRPDAGAYLASLGGPLPYMLRLREIADQVALHEQRLGYAWHELAVAAENAVDFETNWPELLAHWDFTELNLLIERHNRNYPAEARLPMDPRTRDFVRINGEDYRRRSLDAAWALERFPAVRALALAR